MILACSVQHSQAPRKDFFNTFYNICIFQAHLLQISIYRRPVFRGGVTGVETPPELWFTWFLLDLCCCHEHHNGSYRPIVGLKCAPECIKMHHFEGENAKIFQTTPPSTPSVPPFECLRHSTPQTTFLDTGLVDVKIYVQNTLVHINWYCSHHSR